MDNTQQLQSSYRMKGIFKTTEIESQHLQKLDFFQNQTQLALFRKQRDEFYSLMREWQSQHSRSGWKTDKELGSRIRSLVSRIGTTGNALAFSRSV